MIDEKHTQTGVAKIRPIVMYPFVEPKSHESLNLLFETLKGLGADERFHTPVTIINNQTKYRNSPPWTDEAQTADAHRRAVDEIVTPVSTVNHTWSTDSCGMWLRGLGESFEQAEQQKSHHDVFWMIPGDFDYSTEQGRIALNRLKEIPLKVYDAECEICLGEIKVPVNSAKQLIDTYGTYGLLYNWFPAEAQGIRRKTDKPRTEFFALNYLTLGQALIPNRWFAYEQTLMILLQNMNGDKPQREIKRVDLGLITDEEATRSTLAAAMQQVERTERALKLYWREREMSRGRQDWQDQFRSLDAQSESVRTAAMVILRRVLPK